MLRCIGIEFFSRLNCFWNLGVMIVFVSVSWFGVVFFLFFCWKNMNELMLNVYEFVVFGIGV